MTLKNILEFNIKINSLQDQSLLEFKTKLIDWNSWGMNVFFNFTNPTLVSTGS